MASYLPWIFVPLIGMVVPAVAMGLFFIHVESDE